MRLITLELADFQAHEKTLIEFSPTITTIRGPTDTGKSSILRALRWVCLNDLAGDGFVRDGAKKAIATITIDLGEKKKGIITSKITRTKSISTTGINLYELDEQEFKAFGQAVPSSISNLLNLNDINFQAQHDSPFWFNETAGEVSRRLNAVIDLSVIDSVLTHITSQVRRAQENLSFIQDRLAEATKELEALLPDRDRIQQWEEITSLHERFERFKEDHDTLEEVTTKARGYRKIARARQEAFDDGQAALVAGREARQLDGDHRLLHDIVHNVTCLGAIVAPPDFDPIISLYDEWEYIARLVDRLELGIQSIESKKADAKTKFDNYLAAESKFRREVKGKECPLCRRPIR